MLTVQDHNIEFNGGSRNNADLFDPKPFSNFIGTGITFKELVHRLSPFLLIALLLPSFALYTAVAGVQLFATFWLQLIFFVLIESYLLFIDFILWNYFEGKLKLRIWLIECLFISFAIALFMEKL